MPHAPLGRALMLAASLAFAGAVDAQKMYKWVDEKGVTHFSENPPADGEPRVTPPSGPPPKKGSAPETWRDQEAEFRKRQIERGQREKLEARDSVERQGRCRDARDKLSYYRTGRIYRDQDDGSRTWMSEAERESVMEKYRGLIKEYCD